MKKNVLKVTNILLSTVIAALGFGACKSSKSATKEDVKAPKPASGLLQEDKEIRVVYGPPPAYLQEGYNQRQRPDSIKTKDGE